MSRLINRSDLAFLTEHPFLPRRLPHRGLDPGHNGCVSVTDRYAPSPTAQLHLGNLRTALAGWLLTRRSGGRWLMRVEDLDEARVRAGEGVAEQQLEDLRGLGLDWDGDVVWQSQRLEAYATAVAAL